MPLFTGALRRLIFGHERELLAAGPPRILLNAGGRLSDLPRVSATHRQDKQLLLALDR